MEWNISALQELFADFVEKYRHFDNITSFSENEFIADYNSWAKQNGYFPSSNKAKAVYSKASDGIPFIPFNKTTQFLILEAVRVLREIDSTLHKILSQIIELAKKLPEYTIVKSIRGVGDKLAFKLIAEIGDVRRFRSAKSLIAFAGIDVIPYQSGNFKAENRKISKRGSPLLRKIGYKVMMCIKGLNKFLRIYYARIKEFYSYLGIDFC